MCGARRKFEKKFCSIDDLRHATMPRLPDSRPNAALQHKNGEVQHSQSESACCDAKSTYSARLMAYTHNYELPLNAADRLGGDF
jgi:hypothetical protein